MRALVAMATLGLFGCEIETTPLTGQRPGSTADAGDDRDASARVDASAGLDAGDQDGGTVDSGPAMDAGIDAGPVLPPVNCAAALARSPGAPSGLYTIEPVGRDTIEVYCDMERFGGGWTRTALVDASTRSCPADWFLADPPGVCTRPDSGTASQVDTTFSSPQGPYTEVMGWIRGLQFSSMDGFVMYGANDTLMDYYVDGISITTVEQPPQHVWTYAVAWSDDDNRENSLCPCLGGAAAPPYVGTDFYCESGTTGTGWTSAWFVDDPLWDGDGQGTNCDTPANPSVFQKSLVQSIEVPLRVRLMADQATTNENVGVTEMQLFVR